LLYRPDRQQKPADEAEDQTSRNPVDVTQAAASRNHESDDGAKTPHEEQQEEFNGPEVRHLSRLVTWRLSASSVRMSTRAAAWNKSLQRRWRDW